MQANLCIPLCTCVILQGHGLATAPPAFEMGSPLSLECSDSLSWPWSTRVLPVSASPVLFSDVPFYCGRLRALISFPLEHVGRKLQASLVFLSILIPSVHTELFLPPLTISNLNKNNCRDHRLKERGI